MVKIATSIKCICNAIFSFTIMVEKPTPNKPPVLQSPWKEPTIFFEYFFWRVIDCVFIAMFKIRELNENKHKATTNKNGVVANLINVSAIVKKKIETING